MYKPTFVGPVPPSEISKMNTNALNQMIQLKMINPLEAQQFASHHNPYEVMDYLKHTSENYAKKQQMLAHDAELKRKKANLMIPSSPLNRPVSSYNGMPGTVGVAKPMLTQGPLSLGTAMSASTRTLPQLQPFVDSMKTATNRSNYIAQNTAYSQPKLNLNPFNVYTPAHAYGIPTDDQMSIYDRDTE
jgi:hypothetical protein